MHRLDHDGVVSIIGGFERDIAAVGAVPAQVATGCIQVVPAGLGKLRRMRHDPDALGYIVGTRPGFMRFHQPGAWIGKSIIVGSDQVPVEIGHRSGVNIATIYSHRHRSCIIGILGAAFAGPQRFAQSPGICRAGAVHPLVTLRRAASVMIADNINSGIEGRIIGHVCGHRPTRAYTTIPCVGGDDLDAAQTGVVQRGSESFKPVYVVPAFIRAANGINGQVVI